MIEWAARADNRTPAVADIARLILVMAEEEKSAVVPLRNAEDLGEAATTRRVSVDSIPNPTRPGDFAVELDSPGVWAEGLALVKVAVNERLDQKSTELGAQASCPTAMQTDQAALDGIAETADPRVVTDAE